MDLKINHGVKHGPVGAEAAAKTLDLHTLSLSSYQLTKEGPTTVRAAAAAPNLHTLDLSDNNLREHGRATAEAAVKAKKLECLHLIGNGFTNEDAIAIGKTLASHSIKMEIEEKYQALIIDAVKADNKSLLIIFTLYLMFNK